jgi:hypothetical protein
LHLVERVDIVRIGGHDREHVALRIVENRHDAEAFDELSRHAIERRAIDVGARELLRRDVARLVDRREVLQKLGLGHGLGFEERLLDAKARPLLRRRRSVVLLFRDASFAK